MKKCAELIKFGVRTIGLPCAQGIEAAGCLKDGILFSLFHRAFFNSIMYKTPTYALFHSTLYYSSVLITLK